MVVGRAGDADPARLGKRLQARRDVDPVAEEVAVASDHIAEIDADPERHAAVSRQVGVAALERALNRNGASDRLHGAHEFDHDAVAGRVEDAALMFGCGPAMTSR